MIGSSYSYLFIMAAILVCIGLFIGLLNFNYSITTIKEILSSPTAYLTYDDNSFIKREIKNLFIQFIMMVNGKNKSNINNCQWISNKIKSYIIHHLDHMRVIATKEVLSINLLEFNFQHIKAEIISSNLQNEKYKVTDTFTFEKSKETGGLIITGIHVKKYSTIFDILSPHLNKEKNS